MKTDNVVKKTTKDGEFETIPDWDFSEDVSPDKREYSKNLYNRLIEDFSDLKDKDLEYLVETKKMEAKDAATFLLYKNKEDKVEKSEKNQIKGGLADNLSVKDIADKHKVDVSKIKEQLTKGVKVEMEHTDDPKKAVEIALDHLVESPIYYDELEKMESKFHDKK